MTDDDLPVGTLLSRRAAIRLLTASSVALGALETLTAQERGGVCVVRPELEEGPYFVDDRMMRSDVRVDSATGAARPGVPLSLAFTLAGLTNGRCTALREAAIHIWQCDALGEYSGVSGRGQATSAASHDFLRGVQRTGADGVAQFTTIYPGWYPGRAVHTHFKIRTIGVDGQAYEFTSQLFYPEELTDRIHAAGPYAQHGRRDIINSRDGIYRNGGDQLLLQPAKRADGSYQATVAIALDLADATAGRRDGGMRGGVGRRGR
jgi:protocatechuate 3,4-dioxygenase beta subunit